MLLEIKRRYNSEILRFNKYGGTPAWDEPPGQHGNWLEPNQSDQDGVWADFTFSGSGQIKISANQGWGLVSPDIN